MSEKSKPIRNRSEIVFIYDVRENNPNGDPLAENRPRIDEETNTCFVTDVRLKRTVRDYLRMHENQLILIDDFEKDDGTIKMAKDRAEELGVIAAGKDGGKVLLQKCIDARLFGCALPLGEKARSLQITGPVQFNYGRSVHQVDAILVQGTAAFASKGGAMNRSFRTDYIIHYGLFKFYGIVNENLAKISTMTQADLDLLVKALWKGTERLQSRSKVGHMPRVLIRVEYKEPNFFIGQIDKLVDVQKKDPAQADQALRDVVEFTFNWDPLFTRLAEHKDKVEAIEVVVDPAIQLAGRSLVEWKKTLPLIKEATW